MTTQQQDDKGVPLAPFITEVTFSQPVDSCDPNQGDLTNQYLDITVENAGDGHYIVIKTNRWALEASDLIWLHEECLRLIRKADQVWEDE